MTVKAINILKTMSAVLLIVLSFSLVVPGFVDAQAAAPTTTVSLAGTSGNDGWFRSDVVVTMVASDASGAGINRTEYSYNSSVWYRYTGPFNLSKEGRTAIYYRSVDNASNVETAKAVTISIDKTPPSISYVLTPAPNSNGWCNQNVELHFDVSDSGSGLVYHTPDISIFNEGTYSSLTGTATDAAGNEAVVTVPTFHVDKTMPFIGNLTVVDTVYADIYVTVSAEAVEANPDRVEMDWGDGTVSLPSISDNVVRSMHAYKHAGKYTVTLTVVDLAGNTAKSTALMNVESLSGQVTPTPEPTANTPQPTANATVAPTPTPTPVPATPKPAPGLTLPVSGLAILAGVVLCLRARKRA